MIKRCHKKFLSPQDLLVNGGFSFSLKTACLRQDLSTRSKWFTIVSESSKNKTVQCVFIQICLHKLNKSDEYMKCKNPNNISVRVTNKLTYLLGKHRHSEEIK